MSDHSFRCPSRRAVEFERRNTHRLATARDPLTPDEVALWRLSLSGLNTAEGKQEQLRVCRDLLAHAPEDGMLDSDARIILEAVRDLEQELSGEPKTRPISSGVGDADIAGGDGALDAEDDEFDPGFLIGHSDDEPDLLD